jgi:ABC-type uncharacterized transport system permease subunit
MKPYLYIIRTAAREDRANAKRLIGGMLISTLRVGMIAAIYQMAYQHAAGKSGLSYENAVWSIAIYFAFIVNLGLRNIFRLVESAVRTGAVEVGITKPIDWRLGKVCELLGKNGLEFLLQLVILPLFLLLTIGVPSVSHLSAISVLAFALLTVLAMVAASALFLTIGLVAFWLNDAQSVFRIFDKLAMIFGGAFVPIALLPHAAQAFVRYSPFGVYAAPTQLLNPAATHLLAQTVLSAALWSVILVWFCQFVWRRAMARVEVNGG